MQVPKIFPLGQPTPPRFMQIYKLFATQQKSDAKAPPC